MGLPWPPWAPRDFGAEPRRGPGTPPENVKNPPGGPWALPGLLNFAKNAPRTPPGSALAFFEKRCITIGKAYILRLAVSKTHFVNVWRAFWAPREGLGGALLAPRLNLDPPLEIASARVRLALFCVRAGTPPENPVSLKYTYLQCFLMTFQRTGAPKWGPPGTTRILRRPPGEPKEPPKKRARAPRAQKAPPGPRQGPPGTAARPPGGPGGPGALPRVHQEPPRTPKDPHRPLK